MNRRTSADSADTHCGYQDAATALERQGSTHSAAKAVPGSTWHEPMTGASRRVAPRRLLGKPWSSCAASDKPQLIAHHLVSHHC